jgi:hypothetical protein
MLLFNAVCVTCSIFQFLVTRDAAILQTEIPPFASMSSEATTSKPEDAAKQTSETQKEGDQTPHLSVLEEDDEFEEFAVQGEHTRTPTNCTTRTRHFRALAETYPRDFRLGRLTNGSGAPWGCRPRCRKVGGRQTMGR